MKRNKRKISKQSTSYNLFETSSRKNMNALKAPAAAVTAATANTSVTLNNQTLDSLKNNDSIQK